MPVAKTAPKFVLDETTARRMAREDPRVLIWILKEERDRPPLELFFAAQFAGETREPEAVTVLVDLLLSHESPLVREGAALGLSQSTETVALDALRRAAATDPSDAVKLAATDALDRD